MKILDLEGIIIPILKNTKECRRNDHLLYIEVVAAANEKLLEGDFKKVFENPKKYGLPPFESVSRCRRKVQEKYEELKFEKVADSRYEKQQDYEDYAINNINFEV